ncbi:MAG: MucR family transcriptional regulator [Pseudomonadota bacterium]|nr:MucR family transcriptional regulator [Pseudomonadota bacterium]
MSKEQLLEMTTEIVSAYVGNNTIAAGELNELIVSIHDSLHNLTTGGVEVEPEPIKPAVPVRRSVTPDYLICLEDGKRLKMLKRHLRTTYGLSPDDYRAKWGLPADYPMVAPNYAQQRSEFAKKIGLGKVGQETRRRVTG